MALFILSVGQQIEERPAAFSVLMKICQLLEQMILKDKIAQGKSVMSSPAVSGARAVAGGAVLCAASGAAAALPPHLDPS